METPRALACVSACSLHGIGRQRIPSTRRRHTITKLIMTLSIATTRKPSLRTTYSLTQFQRPMTPESHTRGGAHTIHALSYLHAHSMHSRITHGSVSCALLCSSTLCSTPYVL